MSEMISPRGRIVRLMFECGIPVAIAGWGFSMMLSPGYFEHGAIVALTAVLFFGGVLWLESRGYSFRAGLAFQLLTLVLLTPISVVALQSFPLKVRGDLREGVYPAGTDIAGVKFDPDTFDLRVYLKNESSSDYSNLDFLIQTDLSIAGAALFNNRFTSCSFDLPSSGVEIIGLSGIDTNGKKVTLPFIPVPGVQPIGPTYRVRCDRIIAHDELQFVFAVVSAAQRNSS